MALMLHIDGTYKLLDLGYPAIVLSVNDSQGSFHLCSICICEEESAESYCWCVISLMSFYLEQELNFNPKNIVGDSAPQISIMQRLLFPNASRVCCWAHVWCNISAIINTF
ncbi:hypothetical protein ENBRE01_2053, partial [Enteropsectra breve]